MSSELPVTTTLLLLLLLLSWPWSRDGRLSGNRSGSYSTSSTMQFGCLTVSRPVSLQQLHHHAACRRASASAVASRPHARRELPPVHPAISEPRGRAGALVRLEASQRPTGAGVQVRAERQVVGAVEGARVVRLHGKASTGMCPALTGAATASAATASSATASSGARRQLGAGPSAVCSASSCSATGCSASSCCRGRRGYRGAIVECAVVTVLP